MLKGRRRTFLNILPHLSMLKAAQPVSHTGINVRIMRINAHSLGSSITQPESHKCQAYNQWGILKISKCQLVSIITRIPSRNRMLQKRPTKAMRINISNGFKRFILFCFILVYHLLVNNCFILFYLFLLFVCLLET